MPSTMATADAVTKLGYGDIHEQLDKYLVALNLIEKGSQSLTFGGKEARFAVHMGRNQGIGARAEGDDLPDAGQNKDVQGSAFLKYEYGRVQGTGQVFEQVNDNAQGFVDWMAREVSSITDTLQRDVNRQIYGDGTGTLCLLTATATAATTITVDDPHWVEEDFYVDVLTQATLGNPTPTKGNTALMTVVSINTATNVITLSGGTITAAIGSAVVRASATYNSWNKEIQGLGLAISTTSVLHGIDPAVWPKWVPGYVASSVGTLTELALTHLAQGIHKKGGAVTDLLTTYGVINAYWNALQGKRQYTGDTVSKMPGGMTVPVFQSVFGDIPITADWAAPAGTLYALNKKEMFIHQKHDWKWMDRTGTMWQQIVNKDAFSATIYKYFNLGFTRRNTFGKLTGITEV